MANDNEYLLLISTMLGLYFKHFPDELGSLPVLSAQLECGDGDLCNRKHLPGHLTASALLLDTGKKSVLLIQHKFLKRWLQPGGHMDPDEHPVNGALRELEEEVGQLSVRLHPWHFLNPIPIDVDSHQIPVNEAKQEPAHLHHDFQYIFLLESATSLQIDVNEVSDYAWVPLDTLGQYEQRLAHTAQKIKSLDLLHQTIL